IMYRTALTVAGLMDIADIEQERYRRAELAGSYSQGFVLLRERDPRSGTIIEDNGEVGRLLRDNTLQPRIDAGKVSESLGDWKVVQGAELRAALQAKLKEEFEDVVTEGKRVLGGEQDQRKRLTVVITNFMEAVRALQRMDQAVLTVAPLQGIDPIRRKIYQLRKDIRTRYGQESTQLLISLLDDMDRIQHRAVAGGQLDLDDSMSYRPEDLLPRTLAAVKRSLVVNVNSQAPLYALRGMLPALGLSSDEITLLVEESAMRPLAQRYFPRVAASKAEVPRNAILASFSDEPNVIAINGVDQLDLLIPIAPFKSLSGPEFDEEEIASIRAKFHLDGRSMIVVGSPKPGELRQVLAYYLRVYGDTPIAKRPVLIVGASIPEGAQVFLKRYGFSGSEIVIRQDTEEPFPSLEHKSVLFLNTEGELAKMYAVAEGR
ncbi:MAG: hypothetical protein K8I00_10380, partial [Candidatus Omnitrophica bacterium]|nr:hypothetical protein [Candidatus Omnitrophota bacterium]